EMLAFEVEAPDMAHILQEEAAGTKRSRARAVWTRLRRFAKALAAIDRLHQYIANPNLALQALSQMPALGWQVTLATYLAAHEVEILLSPCEPATPGGRRSAALHNRACNCLDQLAKVCDEWCQGLHGDLVVIPAKRATERRFFASLPELRVESQACVLVLRLRDTLAEIAASLYTSLATVSTPVGQGVATAGSGTHPLQCARLFYAAADCKLAQLLGLDDAEPSDFAQEKKETIMDAPCPSLALPQLHVWSLDLAEASTADEIFDILVATRVHHKFCLVRRSRSLAVLVAKVEVTLDNLSGAARRPFRAGDQPLDERIGQVADGTSTVSDMQTFDPEDMRIKALLVYRIRKTGGNLRTEIGLEAVEGVLSVESIEKVLGRVSSAEELLRHDLALSRKVASLDVITASCATQPDEQMPAFADAPLDTPSASRMASSEGPAPSKAPIAASADPAGGAETGGALRCEVLKGSNRTLAHLAPRLSAILAGRVGAIRKLTAFPDPLIPAPLGEITLGDFIPAVVTGGAWGNKRLLEGVISALGVAADREWRMDAKEVAGSLPVAGVAADREWRMDAKEVAACRLPKDSRCFLRAVADLGLLLFADSRCFLRAVADLGLLLFAVPPLDAMTDATADEPVPPLDAMTDATADEPVIRYHTFS
ncbi:hypothetical protein T484DRAFT_1774642, partial [Baffinella frigidus]